MTTRRQISDIFELFHLGGYKVQILCTRVAAGKGIFGNPRSPFPKPGDGDESLSGKKSPGMKFLGIGIDFAGIGKKSLFRISFIISHFNNFNRYKKNFLDP